MRSEYEELVSLKLRQARRKEAPHTFVLTVIVGFLCLFGIVGLLSLITGCGPSKPLPAQSRTARQKAADDIWGGHAVASKKRIP